MENQFSFVLYSFFVREKFAKPLYSVQFNHYLGPTQPLIFATVGGNRAYAYECSNDGAIRLLHCYADPDVGIHLCIRFIIKLLNKFTI